MPKKKGQQQALYKTHPGPQDMMLQSDAEELLYGGAVGGGKAAPMRAIVYTPFGPKKMGEIKLGDKVCTPDGTVAQVIQVHPQGKQQLYRVTFDDGASTETTADHLWLAWEIGHGSKRGGERRFGQRSAKVRTTGTLAEMLNRGASPSMQLTVPVYFAPNNGRWGNNRPIHPYVLGVLIGDGSLTQSVQFASADDEIVERVRALTQDSVNKLSAPYGYSLTGGETREGLEKLQLLGKRSEAKFVPDIYKVAPIADRWEIMRGLMDTDGYIDERGHPSFCSVSAQLAKDVQWLARSLGYRASISEKVTTGQLAYNVWIMGGDSGRLFSLNRKKLRGVKRQIRGRRVVSVVATKEEEAQCITIDHPAGLYLADDFIVTHNSYGLRAFAVDYCFRYPGATVGLFRRTYKELEDTHIRMIQQEVPSSVATYMVGRHDLIFPNGSVIMFRYCEQDEDVRGYDTGEFDALCFDELTAFTQFQYTYLLSRLRSAKPWWPGPRVRAACMPGGPGHQWVKRRWIDRLEPFEIARAPDDEGGMTRQFIPAKYTDNPSLTKISPNYVAQLKALTQEEYEAKALGNWDIFTGQFFTRWREHVHTCDYFEPPMEWQRYMAVDYGFAAPYCVLWAARPPNTNHLWVYREHYSAGIPATEQVRLAVEAMGNEKVVSCVLDPSMYARTGRSGSEGSPLSDDWTAGLGGRASVIRGNNERIPGWAILREMLEWTEGPNGEVIVSPRIHIMKNCSNLIRTLPELQHDRTSVEDVNSRGEDHAPDALRYLVRQLFGEPQKPASTQWILGPRGLMRLPQRR